MHRPAGSKHVRSLLAVQAWLCLFLKTQPSPPPALSPKTITAACLPPQSDSIFLGTMGGTTYPVDVQLCGMSPEIISPSRARSRLDYRGNDDPGAVQCLALNPTNKRQVRADHFWLHTHTHTHTHTRCLC